MPKPGPRPYECVRRAWHSDRHRPMRGSIIQQIFRVAHDSHRAETKKKMEWQEKLPVVVLRAEEIMYSKANSEAEYSDLETLWDRVNDAINTIIRRDESTETGKLLPPCIEAALNLGCVPVKASRSQRHSNTRSYLCVRNQPVCVPPPIKSSDDTSNKQNPNLLPIHSRNHLTPSKHKEVSAAHLVSESEKRAMQKGYGSHTAATSNASSCKRFHPSINDPLILQESSKSLNMGSAYPLYYGTYFQPEVSQLGFQSPKYSSKVIVGRPLFPSVLEPIGTRCLQNVYENAPERVAQIALMDNHLKPCDLSLRLGLSPDMCTSSTKVSIQDTGDYGLPSSSQDRDMFSDRPFPLKEFSFFPEKTGNDPSGHGI